MNLAVLKMKSTIFLKQLCPHHKGRSRKALLSPKQLCKPLRSFLILQIKITVFGIFPFNNM